MVTKGLTEWGGRTDVKENKNVSDVIFIHLWCGYGYIISTLRLTNQKKCLLWHSDDRPTWSRPFSIYNYTAAQRDIPKVILYKVSLLFLPAVVEKTNDLDGYIHRINTKTGIHTWNSAYSSCLDVIFFCHLFIYFRYLLFLLSIPFFCALLLLLLLSL